MRMWLARLLISLLLCLVSCQSTFPSLASFSEVMMTIPYRILIGHSIDSSQRFAIQEIINDTFHEINAIYNKWNPSSEISQLNRLQAHQKQVLSPKLFNFFKGLDDFVNISEGRFDPTIEPLQQLWKSKLDQGLTPSKVELTDLKNCIGWDKIHFVDGIFFKEDSRTQLDFGGAAKGLCVDLLMERLNQAGFSNVFIEWGGEIRASGHHPTGRPWNIYISRFGDPNPNHALAYLSLNNQAIATSGDYFQHWIITTSTGETYMYCHVFNPKTLAPLLVQPNSIASASLMASDCLTADSLAKVLMLFDSKEKAIEWISYLQTEIPQLQAWLFTREIQPAKSHSHN